ncbi:exoglucanase A [Acrasis kona]|uniref:Exoglucanase A n=1 Tax=Acrasis kona TaxID=1008807 RepID=A0AAW2ZFJ9_9EUKA
MSNPEEVAKPFHEPLGRERSFAIEHYPEVEPRPIRRIKFFRGLFEEPETPYSRFLVLSGFSVFAGAMSGYVHNWWYESRKPANVSAGTYSRFVWRYFKRPFAFVSCAGILWSGTSMAMEQYNTYQVAPIGKYKPQDLRQRVSASMTVGAVVALFTKNLNKGLATSAVIGFWHYVFLAWYFARGDYYVRLRRLNMKAHRNDPLSGPVPEAIANYKIYDNVFVNNPFLPNLDENNNTNVLPKHINHIVYTNEEKPGFN